MRAETDQVFVYVEIELEPIEMHLLRFEPGLDRLSQVLQATVGAKAEIHKIMAALANKGISIIMTSSELPELVNLTDRCFVLYKGKIVAEFNRENMDEEKLVAAEIGKFNYANN